MYRRVGVDRMLGGVLVRQRGLGRFVCLRGSVRWRLDRLGPRSDVLERCFNCLGVDLIQRSQEQQCLLCRPVQRIGAIVESAAIEMYLAARGVNDFATAKNALSVRIVVEHDPFTGKGRSSKLRHLALRSPLASHYDTTAFNPGRRKPHGAGLDCHCIGRVQGALRVAFTGRPWTRPSSATTPAPCS